MPPPGRAATGASVTQLYSGPGVGEHTETLAKVGFIGRYFTPPDGARGPAVVVWGGSEGGFGVNGEEAALLASHGIPALALAYFDEPGLPCSLSNIPLEYFGNAIRWLRSQPQVTEDQEPRGIIDLGGTPSANNAAHEHDWPAMIRFITTN